MSDLMAPRMSLDQLYILSTQDPSYRNIFAQEALNPRRATEAYLLAAKKDDVGLLESLIQRDGGFLDVDDQDYVDGLPIYIDVFLEHVFANNSHNVFGYLFERYGENETFTSSIPLALGNLVDGIRNSSYGINDLYNALDLVAEKYGDATYEVLNTLQYIIVSGASEKLIDAIFDYAQQRDPSGNLTRDVQTHMDRQARGYTDYRVNVPDTASSWNGY